MLLAGGLHERRTEQEQQLQGLQQRESVRVERELQLQQLHEERLQQLEQNNSILVHKLSQLIDTTGKLRVGDGASRGIGATERMENLAKSNAKLTMQLDKLAMETVWQQLNGNEAIARQQQEIRQSQQQLEAENSSLRSRIEKSEMSRRIEAAEYTRMTSYHVDGAFSTLQVENQALKRLVSGLQTEMGFTETMAMDTLADACRTQKERLQMTEAQNVHLMHQLECSQETTRELESKLTEAYITISRSRGSSQSATTTPGVV